MLLVVVVILAMIAVVVGGSHNESTATRETVSGTTAWYAAHSGLWASANDLGTGGSETGNVSGNVNQTSPAFTVFSGTTDADGDGFVDFSDDDVLLAQENGYFEGRAKSVGANAFHIRAKGVYDGRIRTLEGFAAAQFESASLFSRGAFGDLDFHMDSNVQFDSYDSRDGTYDSQAVNTTSGSPNPPPSGKTYAKTNGDLGSNGQVSMDSNVTVFGDALSGPGLTTQQLGSNTYVSGDSGSLPSVVVHEAPTWTVPGAGDPDINTEVIGYDEHLDSSSNQTWNATNGTKIVLKSLKSTKDLTFRGSSDDTFEVYITTSADSGGDSSKPSFWLDGNTDLHVDQGDPDGDGIPTVIVYNVGKAWIDSNSTINYKGNPHPQEGDPAKFQYYSDYDSTGIIGDGDEGVMFNSNGNASGVFYVPDGHVWYKSNNDHWGAIVGEKVEFDSNADFHYDEALGALNSDPNPVVYYSLGAMREVR